MDLIQVVLILAVIGVLLWAVTSLIPMPQPIKTLITVVVVLALCMWLLGLFGIGSIHVGR